VRKLIGLHLSLGAIFLGGIVTEKFLDQINVGHDHSPAAVPSAAKLVHSITIWNTIVQKLKVTFPKVTDNLATGETTDGDNHFSDST
jgi:hypothetical protein